LNVTVGHDVDAWAYAIEHAMAQALGKGAAKSAIYRSGETDPPTKPYAFDPSKAVDLERFTDFIGRNWRCRRQADT
jgi:hypothetical protein